jgi:tape measure domain-containing protein
MSAIGDIVVNLVARTRQFTSPLSGANCRDMQAFASRAVSLTGVAGAVTGGLTVMGAAGWGVSLAVQAEQAQIAFTTMLGSATQAKTLLGDLSSFAATTPYESPEVVQAGKQLLAYGVSAADIIPTLTQLGDVASGVGAPLGDIAYLFGTAKTQGRLFSADINQFTNRGIPIIDALASTMGVAQSQVKKLVEEGKVGFPELQAAFSHMTGSGSQFGGIMAAQSQSLGGLWSTLKDNVGLALMQISQQFLEAFGIKDLMGTAIGGFESLKGAAVSLGPHIAEVGLIARAMFDGLVTAGQNALAFLGELFGGSAVSWSQSLLETLQFARIFAQNFSAIMAAAVLSSSATLLGLWEDFKNLFTVRIPAVLTHYATAANKVFVETANLAAAAYVKLFDFIRENAGAIGDWIKSGFTKDLTVNWKPITAGFVSAMAAMPIIPDRSLTDMERNLRESAEVAWADIGERFADVERLKPEVAVEAERVRKASPIGQVENMADDEKQTASKEGGFVAALTVGSAGALQALNRGMYGGKTTTQERLLQEQLLAAKKSQASLDKIATTLEGAGNGSDESPVVKL